MCQQVLSAVLKHLPISPAVRTFVLDFESGLWRALRETFGEKKIRGCNFHWSQTVWRKAQDLGLKVWYGWKFCKLCNIAFIIYLCKSGMSYNTHSSTFTKYGCCTVSFLAGVHQARRSAQVCATNPRSVVLASGCHPYTAFERLRRRVSNEQLVQLMDYVDSTWMKSSICPPSSWCTYNVAVRTNNDVEGWHRNLNAQAISGELHFYLLVPLVHRQATILPVQVKLVAEGKLARNRLIHFMYIYLCLSIWSVTTWVSVAACCYYRGGTEVLFTLRHCFACSSIDKTNILWLRHIMRYFVRCSCVRRK